MLLVPPTTVAARTSQPTLPAGAEAARAFFATAAADGEFTGGDGTYSVPLADGRTAWLFGDTFVGGVQPDGSRSDDPTTFVRNSIVLQDGTQFRTAVDRQDGVAFDAARPPGMQENRNGFLDDAWYWPGHGTTRGNDLFVFMNRFTHSDDPNNILGWDWPYRGTDIARFDATTGALQALSPIIGASDVLWGAAVLERDDYTYMYGAEDDTVRGTRYAHVARAPRDQLDHAEAWRFWDGDEWSADADDSIRIGARVSPQFGVMTARDGSTLLVSQDGLAHDIRSWSADRPEGPFFGGGTVATIPAQPAKRHTYNAVPHPQFGGADDGDLVVSYNVGGPDFMDDHESYRPGFLTIPAAQLPGGGVARPTVAAPSPTT